MTNLHESFDTSGDRQEQRKDLWNNKKGREIGRRAALVGEYPYLAAILSCLWELHHGGLVVDNLLAPYYPGEEGILPTPGDGGGSW